MVSIQDLTQISPYEWEIPQSYRPGMRVPVRLFASEELLKDITRDKSLEQAFTGIGWQPDGDARHASGLWISYRRRGRY